MAHGKKATGNWTWGERLFFGLLYLQNVVPYVSWKKVTGKWTSGDSLTFWEALLWKRRPRCFMEKGHRKWTLVESLTFWETLPWKRRPGCFMEKGHWKWMRVESLTFGEIDFASRFPPRQLEASSAETSRHGGFEALENLEKKTMGHLKLIMKTSWNIKKRHFLKCKKQKN